MPQSLTDLTLLKQRDVERLFAACVVTQPANAVTQCGWLRPEVIQDERVRRFWSACLERIPGNEPDATLLAISLELGIPTEIIEWGAVALINHIPSVYAEEISRRAYLANISDKLSSLLAAVRTGDDQEARAVIRSMVEQDVNASVRLPSILDVANKFVDAIRSGRRSIPFYLPSLDKATGGLERQTLTILAGRPSTGKTALAWQVARQAAYSDQKVIFFSLEMSDVNLFARSACPSVGVSWRDVRAGNVSAERIDALESEAYKQAANFDQRLTLIESNQTSDTIWRTVAQHKPDLVVVDHLRLFKDTEESEVRRLGMITQRLKDVSRNFGCAVLCLAQLSRNSENRTDRRPVLADLRDSGQIEENADLVLMLYPEDQKNGYSPVELWIRKFRDGPRDALVRLRFDPKAEWFTPEGP